MPSQILVTPFLASSYLGQFAARPDLGRIEVPVLPHPETLGCVRMPLVAAIKQMKDAYLDQLHSVLAGLDRIQTEPYFFPLPATGDLWGVIRSEDKRLVTFRDQEPGPRSDCVKIGMERHGYRLKVEIAKITTHSDRIMSQRVVSSQDRLVCLPPDYTLQFDKFAVNGLRHYLGLTAVASISEIGLAIFSHLRIKIPQLRPDPLRLLPDRLLDDIVEIGYFHYESQAGSRRITVEGALRVGNIEKQIHEEWIRITVNPRRPNYSHLTPKMMDLWNLADC